MSTPISCCREQDSLNKSWWHSTWDYEYLQPDIPPKHHLMHWFILAIFSSLRKHPDCSGAHPLSYSMANEGSLKLATHIHLVPKSRIGGDKSHLPYMPSKHAFGTTTTIPFTFYLLHWTSYSYSVLTQFLVYKKPKVHHYSHKSHQTLSLINLNSLHQNLSYHTFLHHKAAQMTHTTARQSVSPPLSPLNLVYWFSHNFVLT